MIEVIEYEKNQNSEEYILGIATLLIDNEKRCYQVNRGKNGNGIYISPFSRKMNDKWFKAEVIDSMSKKNEIEKAIKDYISKPQSGSKPQPLNPETKPKTKDEWYSECPF